MNFMWVKIQIVSFSDIFRAVALPFHINYNKTNNNLEISVFNGRSVLVWIVSG